MTFIIDCGSISIGKGAAERMKNSSKQDLNCLGPEDFMAFPGNECSGLFVQNEALHLDLPIIVRHLNHAPVVKVWQSTGNFDGLGGFAVLELYIAPGLE